MITLEEMDNIQNYYAKKLPKSFTRTTVDSEKSTKNPNFQFLYNKFPEFKQKIDQFIAEQKEIENNLVTN